MADTLPLLEEATPRVVFIGSGTRGPFDLQDGGTPIRVRDSSTLVVRRYSSVTDETGTLLTLNTDYTVDNTNVDDATLTLALTQAVLTSSQRLVVERRQGVAGVVSYTSGGNFRGPTLGEAIDKLAERVQELRADMDRAVKVDWKDTGERALPLAPSTQSVLTRETNGAISQIAVGDVQTVSDNIDNINDVADAINTTGVAGALTVTSTGGTSKTLSAWTDDIQDITTDSGVVYAADYVTVGSTSDQSTAMQSALTAATGGKLILPEGTIYCKELSIPPDTDIEGANEDTSILKLPDNSNTFVLASQGYIQNSATVDLGGRYTHFTVDGNKANQSTAKPAMILRSYRSHCSALTVKKSKGKGLLLTALSANSTAVSNGMAENVFDEDCTFQENNEEGWYGEDGSSNQLADWVIETCIFYGNGGTTKYNCYAERSAGAKFLNCQMYSGGIGEAYFDKAGRMVISGNHIDITTAGATSGNVYGLRVLLAGHPTIAITGNQFHNSKASAGSVTWQHMLISSAEADAIAAVAGNTFYSESFSHTAWGHTGSGYSCDDGNAYYQTTQPTPSATVRRGLQSNASGTWTIDQAVAINAVLSQSLAGGSTVGLSSSGEGEVSYKLYRHGSSIGPLLSGYSARGTIASPASINQFDETFRVTAGGYSSSAFRDAGYIRHFVFAATPSSTDMEGQWRIEACAAGSASVTEIARFSHANGFAMFGTNTVVDAARGIRSVSYTSTQLNDITNAVNTANKAAGKMVWNSTASKPVWAVGSTAGSVWVDGAGTTVNTPV